MFERLRLLRKRYILGGLLLAFWLLGMIGLRFLLAELPDIDSLESYTPPLITRILDRHGETISELYTERRVVLPLSQVPIHLQNAFLATEDETFNDHWGINLKGIARAFIKNLRHGK